MAKESGLDKAACWLLIIGGLNVGVNAAFSKDIIGMLGGTVAMVVNVLVGLAALYELYGMFKQ